MQEAQADVEVKTATLKQAQIDFGYTKVKAPISGFTSLNKQDLGSYIGASNDSTILQNIEHQKIYSTNMSEIFKITQNQYKQGYIDFIALQNAKLNYLLSQTNLIKLNQSLLSSTVSLYKDLGGGWDKEY